MKDPHELLDEILAHPQAKEIMECALRNLFGSMEYGGLIGIEDLVTYLENAR